MNFQLIPPVPSHKELVDLAFGRARSKARANTGTQNGNRRLRSDSLQSAKSKEMLKIDVIKDDLVQRLKKVLDTFPETEKLPTFYHKLLELTLDFGELKKSLGAVRWAMQKIRFFQKEYVRKISVERNEAKVNPLGKQFYGRVSSVLKQVNPNLIYLERSRRMMRSYPDIKEMFTVCIYGFPNVGKSTLLNKLTGSKAEVAEYAFTTKGVNSGFLTLDGKRKIQFLDVPGTLAREDKVNNIELIAELVAKELADVIIYIFDLTEYCGYSVKQQLKLYKSLDRKSNMFVYLSKKDIMNEDILKDWIKESKIRDYPIDVLKEKILELVPPEEKTEESEGLTKRHEISNFKNSDSDIEENEDSDEDEDFED
ncbi:50S ribosome-binding GTPase [Candidatus Woesearchaeota archaeon]|nr:50S ribosome-binding GTPase [Candidatus Woesearchaeota archaeon]